MELTIENLLYFLRNNYPNCDDFNVDTDFRNNSIDGDDAVELLISLEKEFNVSFENFPFQRYFLQEIEISRGLSWFGLKRIRAVDEILTVSKLFDYMKDNKIPTN